MIISFIFIYIYYLIIYYLDDIYIQKQKQQQNVIIIIMNKCMNNVCLKKHTHKYQNWLCECVLALFAFVHPILAFHLEILIND